MNARELQQAVMADLEKLFSGTSYKTPHRTMKPIRAYAQVLPKFDAQEIDDFFPYIIVRLDKGGVENQTSAHKVDLLLVVGIYDDATEEYRPGEQYELKENGEPEYVDDDGWDSRNLGPMAVMEVLEKIQAHYEQEPSLQDGDFYFDGPFVWAMQDEESYPYYFGICQVSFTLAAPRKKVSEFV